MKYLYRSRDNRIFGGVLGGVGEYFDIDPVLVRIAFIAFLVMTAVVPGIVAYIAALLLVPEKPMHASHTDAHQGQQQKNDA